MNNNRIYWLDYAKVIGIFLVVYGHGGLCGDLRNYVFSFHMPMFFLISGMLYKPLSLGETIKKNWSGLMIPYLLLNLICYVPLFVISLWHGNLTWESVWHNWGATLLGLGYECNGFVPISTPCWFIYALFIAKVIMSLCTRGNKASIVLLAMASLFLSVVLQMLNWDTWIPVDSALLAIPFLCIGFLLKETIVKMVQRAWGRTDLVMALLFLLWCCLVPINGKVDMNTCLTGSSILLFYVIALIASFVFFRLSYIMYALLKNYRYVTGGVILISRTTILYIAFNLMAIQYTKVIEERLFLFTMIGGIGGLITALVVLLNIFLFVSL